MTSALDVVQNAACPDRWSSTGNGIACPDGHHRPETQPRPAPVNRRCADKITHPTAVANLWRCRFDHRLRATRSSAAINSP